METSASNTLSKKERLCGKTGISKLLAEGKHGSVPGIRYLCLSNTGCEKVRIMVSVPKKLFKRAVKRNLLKRRIRESYRKQKSALIPGHGLDILFMYSTKDVLTYEEIYTAVGEIISKLNKKYAPDVE